MHSVRCHLQPIEQGRLIDAEFIVKGGHYPILGLEHFARCFGIVAFIDIPKAGRPQLQEEEQAGRKA